MQEKVSLKVLLSRQICKGNGYREQGLQQNLMLPLKAVFGMLLMHYFLALMVGCLMVKMHLGKYKRCLLIISETSSLLLVKTLCF